MSSPQVLTGDKMAAQLERFLTDSTRDKAQKAEQSATAKQAEAVGGMDGDFLTTDSAQQMGRPLSRQEIIARLSRMNPRLVFEQSRNFPHVGGIYVLDPEANLNDLDERCRGRRHIVGMEWTGISPEFTTRKVEKDKWGKMQMTGQVRGWRTILMRLIKERLIGVAEAERVFSIAKGRDSQRWYEEIHQC
jgi:hypothetical protein